MGSELTHEVAAPLAPVPDSSVSLINAFPHARTSQIYQLVVDRFPLGRALLALEAPEGSNASMLQVVCRPNALLLSRAWDGVRLHAAVPLRASTNNLPVAGLIYEASAPFGTVGVARGLTLGATNCKARRVELHLDPGASQTLVQAGGEALLVPASIASSTPAHVSTATDAIRLREAMSRVEPLDAVDDPEAPRSRLRACYISASLISAAATDTAAKIVVDLPLSQLQRVLKQPGDLPKRPPLRMGRSAFDVAELVCEFASGAAAVSSEPGFASYLVTRDNAFKHFQDSNPVHFASASRDFVLTIHTHRDAHELMSACEMRSGCTHAPEATLIAEAGLWAGTVAIRIPAHTAKWVLATMGRGDRLVLGLRRDGAVTVFVARGLAADTLVAAPV